MKYLRNPVTNSVIKGEYFGDFFNDWTELGQNEIMDYELEQAKQKKLNELYTYYDSDECWTYKIKNGDASLTKTADWFGRMIPACEGFTIQLFTDSGQTVPFLLTSEIAKKLNYQIQAVVSFSVKMAKILCENSIKSCTSLSEKEVRINEKANSGNFLESIDPKASLGEVPRLIDIAKL